ncbi:MAG: DUF6473 family protein [Pseudomonadota bacterium]
MTYDVLGAGALNYAPCRYGNSRILFRGPKRRLDLPYVAFIGGTKTYGKFVETPFPALIERDLGMTCVNFGIANAGIDVFLNDPMVLDAANGAEATVLQMFGAQNLSNRFYTVHPRRNDRFVNASPLLTSIYPEVDFSEFHFTRHMLMNLHQVSAERFGAVRQELQTAWTARMQLLLRRIEGQVLLLWFSDHEPPPNARAELNPAECGDPMFVTREMVDALAQHAARFIEVTTSEVAREAGTEGMVFGEMEALAAHQVMGPLAHQEASQMVGEALREWLP